MEDKVELEELESVDGFLKCPFCGAKPVYHPYGTCNSIRCDGCDVGFEWQVCDVVDNWTQYDFINTKEYVGYEKEAVLLTKEALKKVWNIRAITSREEKLVEALKEIAHLSNKIGICECGGDGVYLAIAMKALELLNLEEEKEDETEA